MNPKGDDENPADFDAFGEADAGPASSPNDDSSGIDMPEESLQGSAEESPILEPVARKDPRRASSESTIGPPEPKKTRPSGTNWPLIAGIATVTVTGLAFAAWQFRPTATGDPAIASTETPGTETPGTGTPGTGTPGTGTPGTETPGTETPGTETPGLPSATASVDQVLLKMAEDASASQDSIKAEIQAFEAKGDISEQDRQRLQTIKDAIELLDKKLPTPKRKNNAATGETPGNVNDISVTDGRRYASLLLGVNPQTESSAQGTGSTDDRLPLETVCEFLNKGVAEYENSNFVDALDSCNRAEFHLSETLRSGTSPLEKLFLEKIWELKRSCNEEIMVETSSSVAEAQRSAEVAANSATNAATAATDAEAASAASKESANNAEALSTDAEKSSKDAAESADNAKRLADTANESATMASDAATLVQKAAAVALEERDRQSIRSTLAVQGSGAEILERLKALMPSVDAPAANEDPQFQGPSQDEYAAFEALIQSLTPAEPETIDSVLQTLNGEQLQKSALELELLQRQLSRWEQSQSETRVRNLIAAGVGKSGTGTPGAGVTSVDMVALIQKAEAAGKKAATSEVAILNVDAKIEAKLKMDVAPMIETVSNHLMTAKDTLEKQIRDLSTQGISSEKQVAIESNVVNAVLSRLSGVDGIPLPPDDGTIPSGAAGDYFSRGIVAFFSRNCPDYLAAKKFFGLAARINPKDPVYRYFLAATLQRLGETDEAILQAKAGSRLEQKMPSYLKAEIGPRLERLQGSVRQWVENMRLTLGFGT